MNINKQKTKENLLLDGHEIAIEQANKIVRGMIQKLGYPYKIFSSEANYEEVMAAYNAAAQRGKKEGFTPVLVPTDDILEEYFEILEEEEFSLKDILGMELESGKDILSRRLEEYTIDEDAFDMDEFIGEFDGKPERIEKFSAFSDYRTEGNVETILFMVPTTNPWELVAYIPFGGWNECPPIEMMMAICKYWYEKYGATPVTISHDVMEMQISKPIGEREALSVAKEHYAFTPDRVDQCTTTGTLSELAACLAVSQIWYFWWD